jgi:soluble lytic murein transglycosylase-like protein
MVMGVVVAGSATRAPAHIYSVRDPSSGVIYYTNAPTAAAARIVVRELPRPLPVSALSPSRVAATTESGTPKTFDRLIRDIAGAYGVEYALVKAVIKAESAFNHRAISPKGAQGLMQLMPATARQHGVADAFAPKDNIEGGVRHLRWLLDRYGGNVEYSVAAYNAGHARVEAAGGIPNIAETREYLKRVLRFRENYRREPAGDRPAERFKDKGPGVLFVSGRR